MCVFFFFKQKTAYERRISDWSSDVCSSDLPAVEVREEQCILHMRSLEPLAALPTRLLDRLVHWAEVRPQQTFIAARQAGGDWRRVSYAQMLDKHGREWDGERV